MISLKSLIRAAVMVAASALLSCAVPATSLVNIAAGSYGFKRSVEQGGVFQHVVYRNRGLPNQAPLHVYIEGDGVAWRYRFFVATDPTPSSPLMLGLMAADNARAIYLGRPCYFGLHDSAGCRSEYWTFRRYSEEVVDSMVRVIEREAVDAGAVVLFGHSGGGALAVLLAERIKGVSAVVTLAGNLDTDAWVGHHRYSPLKGSLNPAAQPALPSHIRQLHLLGTRDQVIPPALVAHWIDRQTSALAWYRDHNHNCCWAQEWPQVLRWVAAQ